MKKFFVSSLAAMLIAFSVTATAGTVFAAQYANDGTVLSSREEDSELSGQAAQGGKQPQDIAEVKKASLTPQLIITSSSFGKETVSGGEKFDLTYTLKNTSKNLKIENAVIKVNSGEAFSITSGSNTTLVEAIGAGASVKLTVPLTVGLTAKTGSYPVSISIAYEYFDNGDKNQGSSEISISIPLSQEDKFSVSDISLGSQVYVEQEGALSFKLINSGYTALKNISMEVLNDKGEKITGAYYGSAEPSTEIDAGAKMSITPDKEGEIQYKLVINYEDELGNPKSFTKDFAVTASVYKSPYEDVTSQNTPEEKDPVVSVLVAAAVGFALLIAAIVVTVIVVRKKKAKARLKAEQNDFETEDDI